MSCNLLINPLAFRGRNCFAQLFSVKLIMLRVKVLLYLHGSAAYQRNSSTCQSLQLLWYNFRLSENGTLCLYVISFDKNKTILVLQLPYA